MSHSHNFTKTSLCEIQRRSMGLCHGVWLLIRRVQTPNRMADFLTKRIDSSKTKRRIDLNHESECSSNWYKVVVAVCPSCLQNFHWTSSFLQPSADSWEKGCPFYLRERSTVTTHTYVLTRGRMQTHAGHSIAFNMFFFCTLWPYDLLTEY